VGRTFEEPSRWIAIALGAVIGCSSAPSTQPPNESNVRAPEAKRERGEWTGYGTEEELRPILARLVRMRDGMVYRLGIVVDLRQYSERRDSTGLICGRTILDSGPIPGRSGWLTSFTTPLSEARYPRPLGAMIWPDPEYVIRLWGEGDTMTVATGSDCSWFFLYPVPGRLYGPMIQGHLEAERDQVCGLIESALHTAKQ
jgi:hypothetical protein